MSCFSFQFRKDWGEAVTSGVLWPGAKGVSGRGDVLSLLVTSRAGPGDTGLASFSS